MKGESARARHGGAEVRAADAEIDDVGEALAVGGGDFAVPHGLGEFKYFAQFSENVRHDIAPAREHRRAGEIAQGHVQRRATLGDVDGLAGEERGAPRLDICGAGEIDQEAKRLVVEAMLGEIEQEIVQLRHGSGQIDADRRRTDPRSCVRTSFADALRARPRPSRSSLLDM